MLQDGIPIRKEEAKEYPILPEDVYQAQLLDVTSVVKPKFKKPDETEIILEFQFVLLHGKDIDGTDLRGRCIWRNWVPNYLFMGRNGKNLLYQILEALVKHELTPEEEATLGTSFINGLVEKQIRLVVKNVTKDGKTYSNIETFLPATEPLTPLTDEEKDNATVKNKKEDTTANQATTPVAPGIPAAPSRTVSAEEEEIDVSDIPF